MASDIVSLPKPWADFLREVDSALSRMITLRCVGGFVLTALYGLPRTTGDIDYIDVLPADGFQEIEKIGGLDSALAKKYHLSFQGVTIADYPDGYDTRLKELKTGFQNLKLWALDPYDLLLSKLPRNSPKDREDAQYLVRKVNLEFAVFNDRWQKEMAPWIANRERHQLTVQLWKQYFPK